MYLNLYSPLDDSYNSNSQKIRVLTEEWVGEYIFCPSCGLPINNYENDKPVADFYCSSCNEDYELKSKQIAMGKKIVDGGYATMIERLQCNENPNFFFLNYDKDTCDVKNFVVIPKHFLHQRLLKKENL